MSEPLLTICIATVPERSACFRNLFDMLHRQCGGDTVEILVDGRPRGELSIGAKRQQMNEQARGEYVVHIDDDDWLPSDYVEQVVAALESSPDCVGHYELVEGLAKAPQLSIWTNKAPAWLDGPKAKPYGVAYVRTPFHKTPMRREIALQIGIRDMRFAEDHDFSKRLKESRLIRSEVFIPRVLYFYRYVHQDHATKYGTA